MASLRPTDEYIYRYETHCHTSWCSGCAHNTPQEMAEAYYRAGYAGLIFTDHFLTGNTAIDRSLPWEEKVKAYYSVYEAGRAWAAQKKQDGGRDFHVLFGIEHHYGHGKEVLTYGIDLDFLLMHPNIDRLPLEQYAPLVREYGGFLSMAHPFRRRGYIDMDFMPQPEFLDGAEVYNYCNSELDNREAFELAGLYHLLPTSGGDVHSDDFEGIGQSGLAFKVPITTNEELVRTLRSGDYRLIIHGETI